MTVSVISSHLPFKEEHTRFAMVPYKPLADEADEGFINLLKRFQLHTLSLHLVRYLRNIKSGRKYKFTFKPRF